MTTTYLSPEPRWLTTNVTGTIGVERWPSERPLFALAAVVSVLLWVVLTVSIVGIAYAAMIGIFLFFMQAAFIAHVRGSGVRLGPDQFPELYARVQEIGDRMGLHQVPDAYLMQGGGALNAFAARFLGRHIVVLFSDLLEACGDDAAARDMIIGHELGHVHAGHLRWRLLLLPSAFVPFLAHALSQAREYTCDRYGWASANDADGAQLGLAILAAGRYGPLVNRQALVRQRMDLATGWMTIGRWLSSHPPLANRLLALDPRLSDGRVPSSAGTLRAAAIIGLLFVPVLAGMWFGGKALAKSFAESVAEARAALEPTSPLTDEEYRTLLQQLETNVQALSAFLEGESALGRGFPADVSELMARWAAANQGQPLPSDPFDGLALGYFRTGEGYVLWSTGRDGVADTDDDLEYTFSAAQ